MTDLKIYGELLTATADDRVKEYRLLPFGAVGNTSAGKVFASEQSVDVPEDISHLVVNTEHDRMKPVGRFVQVRREADGLYASVNVSKFPRGDEALAKIGTGELDGISVEIAQPVIKDGALVAGELIGAALCKRPAFKEALLMASDAGEVTEDLLPKLEALREALDEAMESLKPEEEPPAPETEPKPEEGPIMASAAPTRPAQPRSGNPADAIKTFEQGVALFAKAAESRDASLLAAIREAGLAGENNLFAALTPVTSANGEAAVGQAQWLGEAWSGKQYQRRYAPLLTSAALTNWYVEGWRFTKRPVVGDYSGHPAQIPTGPVTTEPFRVEASRLAGGNSLDLKYKHFGDTEFLNAYYRAQIEEYAIESDARALAHIVESASAVTAGSVPTGVSAAAAAIVDGALSMVGFATPTSALVPVADYRELLLTREDDSLKYLSSSLNLEDGSLAGFSIIPSEDVDAVHVIAKPAARFFELGGGAPIRVEADTPANGGFDTAIFGYTAAVTDDARGIVRVERAAAGA